MNEELACYQRGRHSYFPHRNREYRPNAYKIPIGNFASDETCRVGQCHLHASCVKCHLCRHAIVGTRLRPEVDERCDHDFHGTGNCKG